MKKIVSRIYELYLIDEIKSAQDINFIEDVYDTHQYIKFLFAMSCDYVEDYSTLDLKLDLSVNLVLAAKELTTDILTYIPKTQGERELLNQLKIYNNE